MKQANRSDIEITEEDRRDIWQRYEKLQPAMKVSVDYKERKSHDGTY